MTRLSTLNTDLKTQFRSALWRGTGEAHLLIQDNPNIDFSEELVPFLSVGGYDAQCEGSRGAYLFELIELCGSPDALWSEVYRQLDNEKDDTWAFDQLMDLACRGAKSGRDDAVDVAKRNFAAHDIPGSLHFGSNYLIDLLGMEGVMFVLDRLGQKLADDDNLSFDRYLTDDPLDDSVWEEASKTDNPNILRYLEQLPERFERSRPPKRTYDQFLSRVADGERGYGRWDFSDEERLDLVNRFINAETAELKAAYLRGFRPDNYPGPYEPLLEIARRPPRNEHDLDRSRTLPILSHFSAPEIRKLAIERTTKTDPELEFLPLLGLNYEPGDADLLCTIIDDVADEHDIEQLAWSFTFIYSKVNAPECLRPLTKLYSKMNCGIHRQEVVQILADNSVLPEQILREIEHDSNASVRELFHELHPESK